MIKESLYKGEIDMWETLRKEETLRTLRTNRKSGLTKEEVVFRQQKYGKNKLKDKPKETLLVKFIKQFNDFMIIILIVASIISAGISYIQGENDYVDSIIIIAIVILNAIMGVVQEAKAEKSIEALKEMTPPKAKVLRDNIVAEVKAEDLVPGDIVILEAGGYVPADCRLIESHNLKVEESSLTGETEPVTKDSEMICKAPLENINGKVQTSRVTIGDRFNMAFMASIVVNGHAKAVVTDTGMNTEVGKIANMIIEDEAPETPIQKKLSQVGKILGIVCLAICVIIFAIGLIKNIDPMEMFMTSVGLAVAAIPEGLPAIVTIMLSIGVTKMAKNNSIIRKLPAVETLGSSKVICSDKTGTLTQNKMTVVEIIANDKNFATELGTMCTDCEITYEKGKNKVSGEPTEIALVENGIKNNINKVQMEQEMPRVNEIPFDSTRKMMTTIHKVGERYRIITKGAPDVLLDRCKISSGEKERIKENNLKMAKKALRVIAVAYKEVDRLPEKIDSSNIEKNLNFVRTNWND